MQPRKEPTVPYVSHQCRQLYTLNKEKIFVTLTDWSVKNIVSKWTKVDTEIYMLLARKNDTLKYCCNAACD